MAFLFKKTRGVLQHYTCRPFYTEKLLSTKMQNVTWKRPGQGHLFTEWELKQEGSVTCSTLVENVPIQWLKFFTALCLSKNDLESASCIGFGLQISLLSRQMSKYWGLTIINFFYKLRKSAFKRSPKAHRSIWR